MGYIITIPGDGEHRVEPGVERKRESIRLFQHYTQYPPETEPEIFTEHGPTLSVEITKPFLAKILAFFDNPKNRELCELEVPPPYPDGE